jgi:DNA-binding NtrC family response regulator
MASPAFHLLVIDDDSLIIDSLRLILPKNWRMTSAQSAVHLDAKMIFHAAFVDMHLSPKSIQAEGPAVIQKISRENPKIEIVAMSGDLSMELMESCLANGARKFLAKPLMVDEVLSTLEKIEALWQMRSLESRGHGHEKKWVGSSTASERIRGQIASLRGEPGPILLEGDTGTGKEVVAQILNQQETGRSFVTVNVAGVTENLFESEMFGHVKGAFTGADSMKIGLAEAAQGGDLFLDEIEALSMPSQVKLLRFLENGEIRKVGAKESTQIKTRVIVATNQNLAALVKEGKFREDLLFRISGKKIQLPPLRDRTDDIAQLAPHFLDQHRPRTNKTLTPEGLRALQNYRWPGNVRELKRICEQLALTSPLPVLRSEDVLRILSNASSEQDPLASQSVDFSKGLPQLVEEFEAAVIQVLLKIEPDIDRAAETLKISRSSIYKKIKDYQIGGPS